MIFIIDTEFTLKACLFNFWTKFCRFNVCQRRGIYWGSDIRRRLTRSKPVWGPIIEQRSWLTHPIPPFPICILPFCCGRPRWNLSRLTMERSCLCSISICHRQDPISDWICWQVTWNWFDLGHSTYHSTCATAEKSWRAPLSTRSWQMSSAPSFNWNSYGAVGACQLIVINVTRNSNKF